ncbi:family 43 glycosylhydrolase [Flavobacterium sp. UMI-01]|uniref:family 43 glycosylhydrolase n=1 Tax=Flavobacterium sp. UMI-01 TaxID=1441053 RepID=UPI001C7D7F14|nr:family 43 glycosylhydrolase [Flavobacterium sp. UMI-01]GIZ09682.1 xylosidase [Flavobacterium sp. UMI-01]
MLKKRKTSNYSLRIVFLIFLLVVFKTEAQKNEKVTITYSAVTGIGEEKGVMRRDPSDVIKVNDLYYVWYSKGPLKTGYDATVWYATSPDGHEWTERGMALAKGKQGSWEAGSVFTPNIMLAEGKYWLFYTGTSKNHGKGFYGDSKIGLAVSDSPNGPWERLPTNPILTNSTNPEDFDSHLIDDACLIARNNQYWLYYKGRKVGESPHQTKMGVAIAEKPEGPYVKYKGNPVIQGNHAVLAWPQAKGVAAMIGVTGPPELVRSVLYSEDGYHFKKTHDVENGPDAGGAYRANNFLDDGKAERIKWGLEIESTKTSLPFLHRYDVNWPKKE